MPNHRSDITKIQFLFLLGCYPGDNDKWPYFWTTGVSLTNSPGIYKKVYVNISEKQSKLIKWLNEIRRAKIASRNTNPLAPNKTLLVCTLFKRLSRFSKGSKQYWGGGGWSHYNFPLQVVLLTLKFWWWGLLSRETMLCTSHTVSHVGLLVVCLWVYI